tara:strand:+ start:281 stop:1000 length:720 start_codon:yes stop_codon:yes gene_type:complete
MSDNALSKQFVESMSLDMNVNIDHVVAIAASKKEQELNVLIKQGNIKVDDLNAELKETRKALKVKSCVYAKFYKGGFDTLWGISSLEQKFKEIREVFGSMGVSVEHEVSTPDFNESSTNPDKIEMSFTVSVKLGSDATWNSKEFQLPRITVILEGPGYMDERTDELNDLWRLCRKIEDLQDQVNEAFTRVCELRRSLSNISSLERQAKGKLAEAALEGSEAGREILDRINGMDTSHLIT